MATPASMLPKPRNTGTYSVDLAHRPEEVAACQRLRYRVFAEELGASIDDAGDGLDRDRFDPHCKHLLVRETQTGHIVATTRLLTQDDAEAAGMFYSEGEFELAPIHALGGRLMEVGRTCVDADFRRGSVLAVLWQGLAQMMVLHRTDYLIGCASIPLSYGDSYLRSALDHLYRNHAAPMHLRVRPRLPLRLPQAPAAEHVILPPLLKGYLRQGALICSEPYLDLSFNVADVFVLLERDRLARRYLRHFVNRG